MFTCQKKACCKRQFKCTTLEVTPLVIDFNFTDGEPKARFTIGQCLGNKKIKVVAQITVGVTTTETVFPSICTDADGNFEFDIPLNTTAVDITVTTLLLVTYDPVCEQRSVCVTFGGQYTPYQAYQLYWRTYDGSENNFSQPQWGQADQPLLRKAASAYDDGSSSLAVRGPNNPNPRMVSNNVCKPPGGGSPVSSAGLRDITWVWGQFVDHEVDLTRTGTAESADMVTPDVLTDPEEDYPGRTISFSRSEFVVNTDPREQPNHISAYIDGTNVYGYSSQRAMALRRLDGSGKLKTVLADNGEEIMPYNVDGWENASLPGQLAEDMFFAGDIRANENVFLSAMHTLFVREHNRLCDEALLHWPHLGTQDELIFQHARRHVTGIMQAITYNEFLPALGLQLPPYTGYKPEVNATIATEFSTVGYRLGHTMLSSSLKTGPGAGDTILLRDAFFQPAYVQANGIDNLLYGATHKLMQEIDRFLVEDVRSFLFGPPTAGSLLDLAALNIQRSRDHGIPGYNAVRVAYGLHSRPTFTSIVGAGALATTLQNLYGHPDHMDPWIGCLVEPHLNNSQLGELLTAILRDQFTRLRDGDRLWYENDPALTDDEKQVISNTTLADVISRNTVYSHSGNVFKA